MQEHVHDKERRRRGSQAERHFPCPCAPGQMVAQLQDALAHGAAEQGAATVDPGAVAEAVEAALLSLHSGSTNPQYLQRGRSLGMNLKQNPELRRRVGSGEVAPEAFVRMTPQDMAPAVSCLLMALRPC